MLTILNSSILGNVENEFRFTYTVEVGFMFYFLSCVLRVQDCAISFSHCHEFYSKSRRYAYIPWYIHNIFRKKIKYRLFLYIDLVLFSLTGFYVHLPLWYHLCKYLTAASSYSDRKTLYASHRGSVR